MRSGAPVRLTISVGGAHLDVVSHDTDFEDIDFDAGVVFPGTVLDAEPPGMPRAGDGIVVNVTFGQ